MGVGGLLMREVQCDLKELLGATIGLVAAKRTDLSWHDQVGFAIIECRRLFRPLRYADSRK